MHTQARVFRYMPVVPLVLINGAEGIGTGWSTFIPNYNPRDVVANVRRLLAGQEMEAMQPWYNGFTGDVLEVPSKTSGKTYTLNGAIAQVQLTCWTCHTSTPGDFMAGSAVGQQDVALGA